jgi:hypothetical protein
MRDATETNEPLANRSATSPNAARSSAVGLRSFVDVVGTRSVSRAIALGSVAEPPLARWAAARRAFARRTVSRRAAARRALVRRAAARRAFARWASARRAAPAAVAPEAVVPVPVVPAGVLGDVVDGAGDVDGTVPEEGACVGSVAPAPGAGSGAGAGVWGAGSGAGAAAAATGQHAAERMQRRERTARGPGAVERTARGRQEHGAFCSRCFVLLELRVFCST